MLSSGRTGRPFILRLVVVPEAKHRCELALIGLAVGSSARRCKAHPTRAIAMHSHGLRRVDEMSQVDPDRTYTELARLYGDPASRGELLTYAASFFGQSMRRTQLGVDANWLLSKAIDKLLVAGMPNNVREPIAYVKTTIRNTWIDQYRHYNSFDSDQNQVYDEYLESDEPDFVDGLIDDLARDYESAMVRERIEEVASQHRPPIPDVLRAMFDNPGLEVAEIADLVGASERTVYRARKTLTPG